MKVEHKDGKTLFSLYAGTKVKLGNDEVTLTNDVQVTVDGQRSYGAIMETLAAAGQLNVHHEAMTRKKDGNIIQYDHTGAVASVTSIPKPQAKPKAKPVPKKVDKKVKKK